MSQDQFLDKIKQIIEEQVEIFDKLPSTEVRNKIPETKRIPTDTSKDGNWHWFEIPDLICVFVDMQGSTKLSARSHHKTLASAYQLFTNTAVRIFHEFETPYIDIKGDGVFALFNSDQIYRALAASVTFKTFVDKTFTPKMKQKTGKDIGGHYGIDQKTVLVRKLGLRMNSRRSDPIRHNEVWAGKPVNIAAKLASTAPFNTLWVSDRYFENLTSDLATKSCGCGYEDEEKTNLWIPISVENHEKLNEKGLGFKTVYELRSNWCSIHGKSYCEELLKLDDN